MFRKFFILLLFLSSTKIFSQEYKWQASLDSIATEGFYKIHLPPSIISKLKNDFSDIRITDKGGKEVPYIFQIEPMVERTVFFKEYKIISQEKSKKQTTLILENAGKNKIDNINLVIKNADVTKTLRLSGSDNRKDWYVIKDRYTISDVFNHLETSTVKIFDFPLSDYEFFKIEISDSLSPPLNITKAGYYDSNTENAKYSETEKPIVTQKDCTETKTSYIKISFSEPQLIDRMDFEIDGPHYFMRDCKLAKKEERIRIIQGRIEQRKIQERYFNTIKEFKLSSNGDNIAYLDDVNTKELYLLISNNDNPPLKIKSIRGFEINRTLVAYFQKGNYKIIFGNEKAQTPNYDLQNFKDSISSFTKITTWNISPMNIPRKEKEKIAESFFASKIFIWSSLIVVLILLGIMSLKMIKEKDNS